MPQIEAFINELKQYQRPRVCNPWRDYHQSLDIGSDAPAIRRRHLETYLRLRLGQARYILIAEAMGYQGRRFSGVPITSERILLGNQTGIQPVGIIGRAGERTSNPQSTGLKRTQSSLGFAEPTATTVWGTLAEYGVHFQQVVLWNIFPFHPYRNEANPLTNRAPSKQELQEGLTFAEMLIGGIYPNTRIIAIGRLSAETLAKSNIQFTHVPHPAQGHTNQFRQAMQEYFG
jgi:hypothetical protein